MILPDRVHEELSNAVLASLTLRKKVKYLKIGKFFNTKNVAMATMMINSKGACYELSDSTTSNSLSQIEVHGDKMI